MERALIVTLSLLYITFSAPSNPFTPGEKVTCVYERVGIFNCNNIEFENTQELADVPGTANYFIDISVVCILLLFAGFAIYNFPLFPFSFPLFFLLDFQGFLLESTWACIHIRD